MRPAPCGYSSAHPRHTEVSWKIHGIATAASLVKGRWHGEAVTEGLLFFDLPPR